MRAKLKRRLARLAARRAAGDAVRDWLTDRAEAARERQAARRDEWLVSPRGVDRVPARLKVDRPVPTVLVESGQSMRASNRAGKREQACQAKQARRAASRTLIARRYENAARAKAEADEAARRERAALIAAMGEHDDGGELR